MNSALTAKEYEARHLVQVYGQLPIEPTGADGVYLHCGDRKIIDFYGAHAVTALGYGHPAMLEALNAQAKSIFFQSNAVAMNIRAKAAETLANFAPDGLDYVFFVNSGSEANENALRVACRVTGRSRVTAIEHSFHGRTAAAGMVTWGARQSWYGFPGGPFNVDFVPRDDLEALDEKITGETAAVIVELVQGLGGAYSLNPEFIRAIADACKKVGALLIVDEVQTGIGRCGRPFATDIYKIKPDILTVAKSVAGGFPCGAMIVTDEIALSLAPGDLGSTFGGGPLACALVNTVIKVIEEEDLMSNVRTVSRMLAEACPVGPVTELQGSGFLIGLRCGPRALAVRNKLLAQDILVGTSADPEVLRLMPPLILEESHMSKLIESLAAI